jgi:hypothetical protein
MNGQIALSMECYIVNGKTIINLFKTKSHKGWSYFIQSLYSTYEVGKKGRLMRFSVECELNKNNYDL